MAQTTRPAWSLKTFFEHIGQAIYQSDTSNLQPTSGSTPSESEVRSEIVIASLKERVKTLSRQLLTRPSNTHYDDSPLEDSRDAYQETSHGGQLMTASPLANHDSTQSASVESAEDSSQSLAGANPVDTHRSLPVRTPKAANQPLQSTTHTVQPKTKPTSYLDLPLEIRQQILSYIVDPEDPSLDDTHLTLTHGPATILSRVSQQVRMDTLYLQLQWHRKHNLQDLLFPIWMGEDQKMFDELKDMIGYQVHTGMTQAQMNFAGREHINRLLQTLDMLRAQRIETKNFTDQLKHTIAMQREVNQELREENEKLVLALELRDIELSGSENEVNA